MASTSFFFFLDCLRSCLEKFGADKYVGLHSSALGVRLFEKKKKERERGKVKIEKTLTLVSCLKVLFFVVLVNSDSMTPCSSHS